MKGHLIIAGGNIKSKRIYEKFVELAGGGKAIIAIVPTAAKDTNEALIKYTDIFKKCGANGDKIIGIKVDPDTEITSIWKKCGDDFENLDFLNDATGVWFTGGDQIRISRAFKTKDGTPTKLLEKINYILESGGVLGGSSAGAAIMSEIMIAGGTSFGALSMPKCRNYIEYRSDPKMERNGTLLILNGLGFFKSGVIDQHFDERSRIGRLIEVLFSEKANKGYGISEDAAIVYDIEKGLINTIGSGGITIIDITEAVRSKIGNYSKITNAKISYLADGEYNYNINEEKFCTIDKDETDSNDYYAYKSYLSKIIFNSSDNCNNITYDMPSNKRLEISLCKNGKKIHYMKSYQPVNKEVGYEIRLYKENEYKKGSMKKGRSFIKAVIDIIPVILNDELIKEVMD